MLFGCLDVWMFVWLCESVWRAFRLRLPPVRSSSLASQAMVSSTDRFACRMQAHVPCRCNDDRVVVVLVCVFASLFLLTCWLCVFVVVCCACVCCVFVCVFVCVCECVCVRVCVCVCVGVCVWVCVGVFVCWETPNNNRAQSVFA
jgi:hypothetical protein